MLQLLQLKSSCSGLSFESVPASVVGGAPSGRLSPVKTRVTTVFFSVKKCQVSTAVTCGLNSPLTAAVLR